MKKLFITAVAVLAFSNAGFAKVDVIKLKVFGTPCSLFARGAVYGYLQTLNGAQPSIETMISIRKSAMEFCESMTPN
jgi:hypothetical protein